ncbi:cysteine peptidase family C39 domain-containing protein [Aphanothece sacrum]|uniref:Peptidase n=1 Tax=Aphanothece sacrum FPU1 TaxID=1920663 RepID=A0A401IC25_APHSA|nr:cysteine peptidase family C39 domain-containing protein [Aphanothece sacrum]GBF78792.1 peptidase [Aphanothece sacrum FPU1]GBF83024.1 peptidase [Aphanothece sacrum FPU3]
MINLIIAGIIGLGMGGFLGNQLAQKGITAENALDKHQKKARGVFLGLAAILTILILVDRLNLYSHAPKIFPIMFLLHLQANFDEILFGFGCFIFGFLLCLEIAGISSSQRRNQLLLGIGAISGCLVLLFYWFSPITNDVGKFKMSDGVVLQSTTVTCAPASIATLARTSGKHPEIVEKDVVKLTQTNRLGTNTLGEINAMEQLGLNPDYHYDMTLDELIKQNKLALLHVKQRWLSQQFPHAVALLKIDPKNKAFMIGNPLFGLDIVTAEQMKDYWFGEVILVN